MKNIYSPSLSRGANYLLIKMIPFVKNNGSKLTSQSEISYLTGIPLRSVKRYTKELKVQNLLLTEKYDKEKKLGYLFVPLINIKKEIKKMSNFKDKSDKTSVPNSSNSNHNRCQNVQNNDDLAPTKNKQFGTSGTATPYNIITNSDDTHYRSSIRIKNTNTELQLRSQEKPLAASQRRPNNVQRVAPESVCNEYDQMMQDLYNKSPSPSARHDKSLPISTLSGSDRYEHLSEIDKSLYKLFDELWSNYPTSPSMPGRGDYQKAKKMFYTKTQLCKDKAQRIVDAVKQAAKDRIKYNQKFHMPHIWRWLEEERYTQISVPVANDEMTRDQILVQEAEIEAKAAAADEELRRIAIQNMIAAGHDPKIYSADHVKQLRDEGLSFIEITNRLKAENLAKKRVTH